MGDPALTRPAPAGLVPGATHAPGRGGWDGEGEGRDGRRGRRRRAGERGRGRGEGAGVDGGGEEGE